MAKRKGSAGKAAPAKQAVKEASSAPQVFDQAAAPESKPKATGGTISRKEQMRAVAAQKRKQQNMMLAGAGVVILLLIALAVFINVRNSQPVVGETTYPTQGNL